jgi:hypothetical protein
MVLLVAFTSPFALFVMMVVLVVITFSEMILNSGRIKLLRFLWVLVISAGLCSFWYNPQFVSLSLASPSGKAVVTALKNLIPLSFFLIPILGSFAFLIFDKRPQLQPLFIALGLTVVFGLLSFAESLASFAVSGQRRYLPEVMLSIAFLWGIVGGFGFELIGFLPKSRWFPVPKGKRKFIKKAIVGFFALFCLAIALLFPYPEIRERTEENTRKLYRETVVVDFSNIRELTSKGARIMGYVIGVFTLLTLAGVHWRLRDRNANGKIY